MSKQPEGPTTDLLLGAASMAETARVHAQFELLYQEALENGEIEETYEEQTRGMCDCGAMKPASECCDFDHYNRNFRSCEG